MIILGVDPGTTTTGFSFIRKEESSFTLLDFGVLTTTPKIGLSHKILEIGNDIKELIALHNPDLIVIEKLFFQTNLKTGIDVAQARGVILYEAMRSGISIQEYTPLQVKKAVTGNGKAQKAQLQNAIKMLFGMTKIPKPDDAADAIGLAYMGFLNSNNIENLN